MKTLFFLFFIISQIFCLAQTDSTNNLVVEESIKILVEKEPEFPGGKKAMFEFIDKNLIYPQTAIDSGIEGVVKVRFTVTKSGILTDFMVVITKEKLGYGLEEAAIDVVKKMPSWKPGSINGVVTPVYYNIPIRFSFYYRTNTVVNEKIPDNIFLISTLKPQFPGGRTAMIDFISKTLKYPKGALDNKIEGKILLKFIIDSIGKVCCVDIVGEPIGYGLEEETIRIIRSMPKWTPAYKDDRPVAVYYRMPITFKFFEE